MERLKKADLDSFVGVGLRNVHYSYLLSRPKVRVQWFEAISENYMDSEGRPREVLLKIREDFPVALHGVSMSIGGFEKPRLNYLQTLKRLNDEVKPFLVSDHLCFTGHHASNTHDLLPLPFTQEAINTVVRNVQYVQEFLGRQLTLENVSSYLRYRQSQMPEEEFLIQVARRSGCKVLLDINNVYVSAKNHGFSAERYVDAFTSQMVAQIHLAGFTDMGSFLFDTHSAEPSKEVWQLYRRTISRMPQTPVLIEWDENIPEWEVLESQAVRAAQIIKEECEQTIA